MDYYCAKCEHYTTCHHKDDICELCGAAQFQMETREDVEMYGSIMPSIPKFQTGDTVLATYDNPRTKKFLQETFTIADMYHDPMIGQWIYCHAIDGAGWPENKLTLIKKVIS